MVEIDVAADADNLVACVTVAVVVVALAVVFDDDYVAVCVAVDVVLVAGFVIFVFAAVDDAGILAVVHVDALYLSNNMFVN